MRAVCEQLDLVLRPVAYSGDDFNGIFAGLAKRTWDAVISGTTITPERSAMVLFSQPYLEFNQGVAVNRRITPHVASTADLRSLTAASSRGTRNHIAAVDQYPVAIGQALDMDTFDAVFLQCFVTFL